MLFGHGGVKSLVESDLFKQSKTSKSDLNLNVKVNRLHIFENEKILKMQSNTTTQDGRSTQNPKKLTYKEVLTGFKPKTRNNSDQPKLSSLSNKSDYNAVSDQFSQRSSEISSEESFYSSKRLNKTQPWKPNISSEKHEPETFSPSQRKVFPRPSKNVPFTPVSLPQVSELSGSKDRNLVRSPRIQSNSNSPGSSHQHSQHRKPGPAKKHKSRALFNTTIRKVDELIYLPSCNGREESTVYFFPEKFSMPCYSFDMVFYDHLALVIPDKKKGKIIKVLVMIIHFRP